MKIFLMLTILFLAGCQNNPNPAEHASNPSNDSLNVKVPIKDMAAEPGSILFETNRILEQINITNDCRFKYAEGNAPNTDIVGETNIMQAEINELEAKILIELFYGKCHDGELEKFSKNAAFWTEGKYSLKAFFNIADQKNSYFTCLIKGNNRYAYYVLGNP